MIEERADPDPGEVVNETVLTLEDVDRPALRVLLGRYGLRLVEVAASEPIPGSYWGDAEAGLRGADVYASRRTPVHSILHETGHYVCMDPERRRALDTDAGGGYDEENAVCCLQILLADQLPGVGAARIMEDMDLWGYSFRLGSARSWFEEDAEDAKAWLLSRGLVDERLQPRWTLRGSA